MEGQLFDVMDLFRDAKCKLIFYVFRMGKVYLEIHHRYLYFISYVHFSSPNEHYRVSRRDSPSRRSRSPQRIPRGSRSPILRCSPTPQKKRRGSPLLEDKREMNKKRSSVGAVGGLLSG